ncbi:uncharacterized protein [Haliotis cracherodii]|uniref:uncharacterized protein n=1 Tax=Haliotis cracherodii TaxID=6455 RepID=UPI0039EA6AE5
MASHVDNICKRAYLNIRNIGQIRQCINAKTAASLVHACVLPHLDFCNGLLIGLPKYLLTKLLRVQNFAARLVTKSKKFDHITPILRNLHWLKCNERIQYKVMLIVFNARHNQKPTYISELLEEYVPGRSLRSSWQSLLSVPSVRTATFGGRSVAKVAPKVAP